MGKHAPLFLKLVDEARSRIDETHIDAVKARIDAREIFHLIDVREAYEFEAGHLPGAIHLSKGTIERDIEQTIPDLGAPIVLYCGGGYRSALVADNLKKMGYTAVQSMDGGYRAWHDAGYLVMHDR
ncbi:MAG: sulfurtransferase [Phycisphaerae bacterium]|nr:sulfurtransferase [Phycisphaerae bacterium]